MQKEIMSITLEQEPPFIQRLIARIGAMRFFSVSLLLHLVLVISLSGVVLFKKIVETPDFVGDGEFVGSGEVSEPGPPPPDVSQPQQPQPTVAPVTPPIQTMAALTTNNAVAPTFSISAMPSAMPNLSNKMLEGGAAEAAVKAIPKIGATALPTMMAARATSNSRGAAMRANKGKDKSEQAVILALRWLQANQNPDGSWGDIAKQAMTGLALLSFLGHGDTNASPEFGATVSKAIDYLVKAKSGDYKPGGGPYPYEHAIVIYALGEAYTMTKLESIKEPIRKGIDIIIKGQTKVGGWVYGYAPEFAHAGATTKALTDTSVLGWQVQALKAAHLTGLEIPGVEEAIEKSTEALKSVRGPRGGFGYTSPGDRYSLTGVGALCIQIHQQMKEPKTEEKGSLLERRDKAPNLAIAPLKKMAAEAVDFILDPKNPPVDYKAKTANLYAWYYHTQACLNQGGSAWGKWNSMFQDEIAKNQSSDGSWPSVATSDPDSVKQGKFTPTGTGNNPSSIVYRTTLCTLMLEVFYRYLPSNK